MNIVAGMLFGAISGSAAAAVAAVGGFMIPRMREQGYDTSFSAAVNVSSATTSLIIPPSNILIVYALASAGVSIAALFVAGYLPGTPRGHSTHGGGGIHRQKARLSRRRPGRPGRDLPALSPPRLPSLFLVVLVMGGIVGGYFTATEAGAIAVVYSFVLGVPVYREVTLRDVPKILVDASVTTSIVMLLVGTSMAFSWVLAYERIPQFVGESFALLGGSPAATFRVSSGSDRHGATHPSGNRRSFVGGKLRGRPAQRVGFAK